VGRGTGPRRRSLGVRLAAGRAHVTLPADYGAQHVALAYARTTHIVQSRTVDTTHTLIDPDAMSRQGLYVGATRGREGNMMHVVTEQLLGLGEGELPPARNHRRTSRPRPPLRRPLRDRTANPGGSPAYEQLILEETRTGESERF
jgi:hypothetical protein